MQDIIPPQKPKKKLKLILIISSIVLFLLIAVTATYFLTKGQFQSKEETKKPVTNESTKKEEGEFVYITSKAGLNLREDASTTAQIVYVMPYRGKIKVEKKSRDGKWIKGIYDGPYEDVTGWFSAEYSSNEEPEDLTAEWKEEAINASMSYTAKVPQDWRMSNPQGSALDFRMIPQSGDGTSEIYIHVLSMDIESAKKTLADAEHSIISDNPMVVDGFKGKKVLVQKSKGGKIIGSSEVMLIDKNGKTIKILGPADNEPNGDIYNLFIWTIKFKEEAKKEETNEQNI